jgi:hypothetical protein
VKFPKLLLEGTNDGFTKTLSLLEVSGNSLVCGGCFLVTFVFCNFDSIICLTFNWVNQMFINVMVITFSFFHLTLPSLGICTGTVVPIQVVQ